MLPDPSNGEVCEAKIGRLHQDDLIDALAHTLAPENDIVTVAGLTADSDSCSVDNEWAIEFISARCNDDLGAEAPIGIAHRRLNRFGPGDNERLVSPVLLG